MSAIPNLKIPVTVVTDQVAPAMKKVEKEISESAARIGKMKSAAMPALGALGAGPLGGILGGISGMGGAGMGIAGIGAAFLAPILASAKLQDALAAQAKGAGQAFEQFKETGAQTAQMNSVLLQRLAQLEPRLSGSKPMGFMAAFENADIAVNNGSFEGISDWWSKRMTEAGALLGSLYGGGSLDRAILEAKLSTAGEGVAQQTAAQIAALPPSAQLPGIYSAEGIAEMRAIRDGIYAQTEQLNAIRRQAI